MTKKLISYDGEAEGLGLPDPVTQRLDARFALKWEGGGSGMGVAPLFLPTLPIGLQGGAPSNVRTGLSPTHGPGGGPVEELSVTVTGTLGEAFLTSPDVSTVSGFGNGRWQGVVSSGDRDFHITVVGNDEAGRIDLLDPLPVNVDGQLSARFDDTSGQHLTRRGTRAYVESLLSISPAVAARGPILDGAWTDQPIPLQDLWKKNDTLAKVTPYNQIEDGIVRVGTLFSGVAVSPADSDTQTMTALTGLSALRVGVDAPGQGAIAEMRPGGQAAVLSFGVGCDRVGHDPHGLVCHVTVIADGNVLVDEDQNGAYRHRHVILPAADRVTVEVTAVSEGIYHLALSETTLRESGEHASPHGAGKIVTLGDSWMAWYDGEFGKALAEKTGAEVINPSVGGMTTEWGLAWWDEYVTKNDPDEVWLHFFTNDLNRLTSNTFTAPDGTTRPMWTTSNIAETHRIWRKNIFEMIRRAQAAGIRPVVIMPSATVGWGQTLRHAEAALELELPALSADYIANAAELSSPDWAGNKRYKYDGKQMRSERSTLWASGPAPTDPWINPLEDTLNSIQQQVLTRADFVADPTTDVAPMPWGTQPDDRSHTITPGEDGTVIAVEWGSPGGGLRFTQNVDVVAGREYLVAAQITDATGTRMGDSGTDISGSWLVFGAPADTLSGGAALLLRRVTASTTGSRRIGVGQLAEPGGTTTFTIVKMFAVDLTSLLATVPAAATWSDAQIAAYADGIT